VLHTDDKLQHPYASNSFRAGDALDGEKHCTGSCAQPAAIVG
jgi:hypothetical protein